MTLYLVKWPNGDFSLISGENPDDLKWRISEIGDPTNDHVEILPITEGVSINFCNVSEDMSRLFQIECFGEELANFLSDHGIELFREAM